MGGLTAWRLRLLAVRRPGVIGAAAFVATGAADVLLAVWSRQPWPPALASVLILVPGLYLAWKAVPGAGRLPRGRRATQWDPIDLGVHDAMGHSPLPCYIRRPHDDVIDALLDPAVVGSRLVVVRGSSSTGKTRAAYEAIASGRLARWRLEYPLNAAALESLLDARFPARTVLWLGELRQYTDGDDGGAAALGRLARLLETQDRVIAVTTMWPEHWKSYSDAVRVRDRPGQEPAGTAGRLMAHLPDLTGHDPARIDAVRGGVVDVPGTFTAREVIAASRADQVLADAATAAKLAGHDGQITQYLAGVPDLLDRFQGSGGNRYGQAVITAAMDAARLGCGGPLPRALLLDAAPGYLTSLERTRETASWAGPALDWATEQLRGTVQAVEPVPPAQGTGVRGYRPADYLEQHGRRTRRHQIGPAELWEALADHITNVADLNRLSWAAEGYGLYRYAAALSTSAAAQESADAAVELIRLLHRASPANVSRAARWTAAHVSLGDPGGIASLMEALRGVGAEDAVSVLLARDPAACASLDNPSGVASLLEELRIVKRGDAVTALLARDPVASVSPDKLGRVGYLMQVLRKVGAEDAVTALARRATVSANLGNSEDVASLLRVAREVGAEDAVTTLLARDPVASVSLDDPWGVSDLLWVLQEVGAEDAVTAMLARDPAASVGLDHSWAVSSLLWVLRKLGAEEATTVLVSRAAATVSLDDPGDVVGWLRALAYMGAEDAVAALVSCAAATVSLDDPGDVANLLGELSRMGANDAVTALLARDPAASACLDYPRGVASLLWQLGETGARDAVTVLAARAESVGISREFLGRPFQAHWPGREPRGTPSGCWNWQEP